MTISVKQNLVDKSKYSLKCPYEMDAECITVHNTANDAPAENEISYMIRNNNEVSYHYAVDDKEVIQGVLESRNAWHCGDGGNGKGNRKSIGIEICYSKVGGDKYKKAEALAVKFIAQLLREKGWEIDRVKKHQDWSGKYCPHRILDEGRWNSFLQEIQNELTPKKVETLKPTPTKQPVKTNSIVDYLKSIGADSSFTNRKKLASQHGIKGYTGTSSQNTLLLEKLITGQAPKKTTIKKFTSIVDYLKHIGVDSSFANRKKLASKYGIRNYKGTASQNTQLLNKMQG